MNNFKKIFFISVLSMGIMQLYSWPHLSDLKKDVSSAAHSVADAASHAISGLTTIRIMNYTGQPIQTEYSEIGFKVGEFTIKYPRVLQADWFDSTKIVTWDLKPELFFNSSSKSSIFKRSGGSAVNFVAYFPGDFYVRADLTTTKK